jgi:autotransporter-associated beta strand protein
LNSDAWITTSGSSDSLSIAGTISDGTSAHDIIKDGLGTLILSGSDNYTGGTTVDAGTLVLASDTALPDGTSLTVGAGGALIFDSSQAVPGPITLAAVSQINPVPEPGTLALLAAGSAVGLAAWQRRRRFRLTAGHATGARRRQRRTISESTAAGTIPRLPLPKKTTSDH